MNKIRFFKDTEEQRIFHQEEFLKLSGLERLNVALKLRRQFNKPFEKPDKKIQFRPSHVS
jgi:hypothetical protein